MYAKLLQIYGALKSVVHSTMMLITNSIQEIFDIIVDFPDSRKALEDLKVMWIVVRGTKSHTDKRL